MVCLEAMGGTASASPDDTVRLSALQTLGSARPLSASFPIVEQQPPSHPLVKGRVHQPLLFLPTIFNRPRSRVGRRQVQGPCRRTHAYSPRSAAASREGTARGEKGRGSPPKGQVQVTARRLGVGQGRVGGAPSRPVAAVTARGVEALAGVQGAHHERSLGSSAAERPGLSD